MKKLLYMYTECLQQLICTQYEIYEKKILKLIELGKNFLQPNK